MSSPSAVDGRPGVTNGRPFAALAMYPFPELRAGWEAVYEVAAAGIPGAPGGLDWDLDPHESWLDPAMQVAMTCGWPLVTLLGDRVRVVGAFGYVLDGASSHLYCSVVIARSDAASPSTAAVAAINSPESLSGNISLCVSFGVGPKDWPGPVVWTGAHVNSIGAVRSGVADVASIDAVSWAVLEREHPATLAGLTVVGRGPAVPCLPFIVNAATSDASLAAWRAGFARAAAEPSLAGVRRDLLVGGFVPLDLADYEAALAPFR